MKCNLDCILNLIKKVKNAIIKYEQMFVYFQ